jgi:hypothetical protein
VTWTLLAVLGLLAAIAVGIAASELTSRRIGLSSEPIRAGDALAPEYHRHDGRGQGDGTKPHGGGDAAPVSPVSPGDSYVPPTTTPDGSATPTAPSTEAGDGDGDVDDD